jgi:hypothetical protein
MPAECGPQRAVLSMCVELTKIMADRVGFEPTMGLHPYRFSRPTPSATRPPVLGGENRGFSGQTQFKLFDIVDNDFYDTAMLFGESKRDRYATLFGDRIHLPLSLSFLFAADTKAAAATALAVGCLAHAAGGDTSTIADAAGFSFLGMVYGRVLERFVMSMWYPGAKNGLKCIDKKPSPAQSARSIEKYGPASDLTRKELLVLSPIAITGTLALSAGLELEGISLFALWAASLPSMLTRIGSAANRHKNIADGKWAVTDTPSPEEVKDEARGSVFSPQPRPVPVPIPVRRR